MSSNDNNNNDDAGKPKLNKEMQRLLKERKEEMMLFDRFKNAATTKLEMMARQVEDSGIKYTMGEEEKNILAQMNGMGIKEGLAAGVATFIILRRGPIYVGRYIYKRRLAARQQQQQMANPGGMRPPQQQQTPPPPPTSAPGMAPPPPSSSGYQLSNPFEKTVAPGDFPRSRNPILRGIWFMFDSVLSLMMGASVSMACTDTDKIRQQLIELPLVSGRSLTSDALCDEIVSELQKVQKEHPPAYERLLKQLQEREREKHSRGSMYNNHNHNNNNNNNNNTSSPGALYLQGIIEFSANCQRRRFAEKQWRQDHGYHDNNSSGMSSSSSSDDDAFSSSRKNNNRAVELDRPVPRDGPRLLVLENGHETVVDNHNSESVFSSSSMMGRERHHRDDDITEDWAHPSNDDDDHRKN